MRSSLGRAERCNRGRPVIKVEIMTNQTRITRRRFIKRACYASSPLVLPYFVPASVFGDTGTPPSERITIGAIGIGSQGTNDLKGFLQLPTALEHHQGIVP